MPTIAPGLGSPESRTLATDLTLPPNGRQREMGDNDLIVSKTNLKGHLTYVNDIFLDIAGLHLGETLGQPHRLIRHAAMPRAIFRLLWDTIEAGREIFAYVVNASTGGDYYWVFAHVTPSYDRTGRLVGYHSNRRKPRKEAVALISPIYAHLLAIESAHKNAKAGLAASHAELQQLIASKGGDYERFVLSL